MKDILLADGKDWMVCEVEELSLTIRFNNDRYYYQFTLRDEESYAKFREFIINIYNECDDPDERFDVINEIIQTDEIDEFITGTRYLLTDNRTEEEIKAYEKEACDKVWLMRLCDIANREPIHEASRPAMERIMSTYNDIPEDGYTTWECGYWNGIMGALRWVMGEEKDYLDT